MSEKATEFKNPLPMIKVSDSQLAFLEEKQAFYSKVLGSPLGINAAVRYCIMIAMDKGKEEECQN